MDQHVTAQQLIAFRLHPLTDGRQQRAPQITENYRRFLEILNDLKRFQVLGFDNAAYQHFLRMGGVQVSVTDRRIAAIALANDFQVVTNNNQDFQRIQQSCPELVIADWISEHA